MAVLDSKAQDAHPYLFFLPRSGKKVKHGARVYRRERATRLTRAVGITADQCAFKNQGSGWAYRLCF